MNVKRNGITRAAVGAIVFACVAACAASAVAQDSFGRNKVQLKKFEWFLLRTPHFDINFPGGYRDLAARTGVILEAGYIKLSNDMSHRVAWRIPVIIYGSHSDFQQTNVIGDLIPEGVQAFAEPMRKRMVLHFGGANADYAHTAVHELVHIFSYDIIYGTLLRSVFSRSMLFPIPLWFMEGLAEYYSSGYDAGGEMFVRDAAVFDYLTDLDYTYGYMAYKSGQSAIYYLNETYGPGKVLEIMDAVRNQRGSIGLALENSLGITSEELSRDWKKSMRRRYWPLYVDKKEPEAYGRRLTDHVKKHHGMNMRPAFSPDGQRLVYFSDLKGLDGIYLMDAVTGRVEKRLVSGMMSTRFESIRSMNSNLTFSRDGSRIAFVAKSHGFDRLFVVSVPKGKVLKEIEMPLDFFISPVWSPTADVIALVGVVKGQTDLYLYDLAAAKLTRLTEDADDEDTPSWFPDGSRIVYSRTAATALQPVFAPDSAGVVRLSGFDFTDPENVRPVDSDIWSLDIATGERRLVIRTSGNDNNPAVIAGGEEIVFTSDEEGIANLYRGSVEVGSYFRFTDLLGGVNSFAHSSAGDRLIYSGFNAGGFDLFAMDGFAERSRTSYSTGGPFVEELAASEAPPDTAAAPPDTAYVERAAADTLRPPAGVAAHESSGGLHGGVAVEATKTALGEPPPIGMGVAGFPAEEIPAVAVDEDTKENIDPDTLTAIRARITKQVGAIQRYHAGLSADYVGNTMGIGYSTGFGFQLYNQMAFSDLLGDHHLLVAFNFIRTIEDSDVLVMYSRLKDRLDYGIGAFQFKNYMNSRVTSIGETFLDYQLFTERNYGVFAMTSYPFSTFTRADLELQAFISEREFYATYVEEGTGYQYYVPQKSKRYFLQPTLSFVHDSAYFGSFGPVIGSRWLFSTSQAVPVTGQSVSRTTFFADYRRYFPVFYRNYLAIRGIAAMSLGNDPQVFFLGGPLTMRGYDYLQFSGSRMLLFNVEYRYPLVDALIFGWPGRWGIQNIGGTLFFDSGSVWGQHMYVEPLPRWLEPRYINDLAFYSDFGVGFYMGFGYFILNFQFGWPTDFSHTGNAEYYFYIGPQF